VTLLIETSTLSIPQKSVLVGVGVTVGVNVAVGVDVTKLTGTQSKKELKSNTEQLTVGVGVAVGQIPDDK
jgi:hypothetical protein